MLNMKHGRNCMSIPPETLQGTNSYWQLGQGHVEDLSVPRPADGALHMGPLRQLTGGGGHSAVLSGECGELLVCGHNHRGQLGLGHSLEVTTFQLCPLIGQRVAHVSCGWDFTLVLTDHGQVLTCGSNAYGQLGVSEPIPHSMVLLPIHSVKEPVIRVAAGLRHSLTVTGTGSVYQWGMGLSGHAKRALSPQPVPAHFTSKTPCLVPGLEQVMSHRVAAGSAHCVSLTGEEVKYRGCLRCVLLLSCFSLPPSLPPSLPSCLVLGMVRPLPSSPHLSPPGGRLLSWGWNEHGMCGDGSETDVSQPQPIPALRPLVIGCGAGHSMALCAVRTGEEKSTEDMEIEQATLV
uniref:Secretion regulating guanine nucleotide exchange factor n=1 Tax=Hucho hucho TaxID=62062 RepID=A0A4W5PH68_9TELE